MDHRHMHALRHHHSRREAGDNVEARGTPSLTSAMEKTRVLVARATCTNDSDAGCRKPTKVPTLPIILAVVIPIVIAAVTLLYLHRRHIRKLREEDAKDKYKSLDFGMDPAAAGGRANRKGPEMSITDAEKSIREGGHNRGMSMDVMSPYILPAGLHGSRDSLHSLSRSTVDQHDPYRPVTFSKDGESIRSGSRAYRHDNGSMYTTSSGGTNTRMNDGLLKNASRMSHSHPIRAESMSPDSEVPEIKFPEPAAVPLSPLNPRNADNAFPAPPAPLQPRSPSPSAQPKNEYVAFQPAELPAPQVKSSPEPAAQAVRPAPARVESQQAFVQNANTQSFMSDSSYGDGFQITPPSPTQKHEPTIAEEGPLAPQPLRPSNDSNRRSILDVDQGAYNTNRLSMSLRPLPPDDPNENPEERANRIRSFYKEYFDDSKPEPAGGHIYNDYYEDYGSEYLDGTMYDSQKNAFVIAQPNAPFAEPVTRRAMTPPPRAPPRFRSGSNAGPLRGPHMSGSSMASSGFLPPRGMSSMSGRLPAPKKPLPPPSALSSLPTPHKLKEDHMVFNPIDFAPPVSFRERQNGLRPDSPLGNSRPYSPSVRPHTPLASSFDDLAVMPSPHMLRKSGTFTALDFAPPPRFRDPEGGGSDAGSIRSNRSGMSSSARMAVRNGAYRVSRIPTDIVSTKDDIASSLRPKLDMVSPA